MAQTVVGMFSPVRFTLGGSDVATRVNIPAGTRYIQVFFEVNPGKLAYSGTDGGAITGQHIPVPPGGFELQHQGDQPIYLAAAIAGTDVAVQAVDRQ